MINYKNSGIRLTQIFELLEASTDTFINPRRTAWLSEKSKSVTAQAFNPGSLKAVKLS